MSVNVYPGVPWQMEVVGVTQAGFRQFSFDLARSREPVSEISIEANLNLVERPAVQNSREYEAWQIFARHPVVWEADGRLMLGDLRYSLFGRDRDWSTMEVSGGPASSSPVPESETAAAR